MVSKTLFSNQKKGHRIFYSISVHRRKRTKNRQQKEKFSTKITRINLPLWNHFVQLAHKRVFQNTQHFWHSDTTKIAIKLRLINTFKSYFTSTAHQLAYTLSFPKLKTYEHIRFPQKRTTLQYQSFKKKKFLHHKMIRFLFPIH